MTRSHIKPHDGTTLIHSLRNKGQYWQCGQWVDGAANGTRYIDEREAECIVGLRCIRDCEVITPSKE